KLHCYGTAVCGKGHKRPPTVVYLPSGHIFVTFSGHSAGQAAAAVGQTKLCVVSAHFRARMAILSLFPATSGDSLMAFSDAQRFLPETHLRRMRREDFSRRLMRETQLTTDCLIYPMLVLEGHQEREKIASMPGIERLSIDLLVAEVK